MEITDSARKHGVSDEDMLHAFRNFQRREYQDDGIWMFIGPNRSGQTILEIAVVMDTQNDRIIHAMPARAKYLR